MNSASRSVGSTPEELQIRAYHDEAEALSYLIRRPSVRAWGCPTVVECTWSHAQVVFVRAEEKVCEVSVGERLSSLASADLALLAHAASRALGKPAALESVAVRTCHSLEFAQSFAYHSLSLLEYLFV